VGGVDLDVVDDASRIAWRQRTMADLPELDPPFTTITSVLTGRAYSRAQRVREEAVAIASARTTDDLRWWFSGGFG
jgi:hypothetical protein